MDCFELVKYGGDDVANLGNDDFDKVGIVQNTLCGLIEYEFDGEVHIVGVLHEVGRGREFYVESFHDSSTIIHLKRLFLQLAIVFETYVQAYVPRPDSC